MSTKPGIPDHFSIHDVRDAAEGSPPAILPKCNCGPRETCQACAKDKSRQFAVHDIREAMHPAGDYGRADPDIDRAFKNVPAIEAILDADPTPTVEEAAAKIAAILEADSIPRERARMAAREMAALGRGAMRPALCPGCKVEPQQRHADGRLFAAGMQSVLDAQAEPDALTPEDAAAFTRQQDRLDAFDRGAPGPHPPRDVRRGFIPIADVPPDVLAEVDCPESPAGAHVHVDTPHVATLPDGSRLNLPAGTVLREGTDARPNTGDAIGLLRKARTLIGSIVPGGAMPADTFRVLSEIVAFLAGAAPPEHPVIAPPLDPDEFFDDVCALIPWEKPDAPERHEILAIVDNMARSYFPPSVLKKRRDASPDPLAK